MPDLEKGQHGPLNVTNKARRRFFVGLGWDPNPKAGLVSTLKNTLSGKKTWHDLDLSCLIFDAQKNPIGTVTADPAHTIDQTGRIYHSGDNVEGLGEGDDEQISVELMNLDTSVHSLIFLATIETGHSFNEVLAPEIRMVDGYSNHTFLHCNLDTQGSEKASTFVFAIVYRGTDGWMLHHVGEFLENTNTIDNPESFISYL